MISNEEWDILTEILENYEDEKLAILYLKELNALSKEQKNLLLNLDKSLNHETWKRKCDEVNLKIKVLIEKIKTE